MSGSNFLDEILDEIVDELEQSDNVTRVKRLILFTCHDYWVNDVKDLQNIDLKELIQELLAVIPSLNNLKLMLHSHVKKLSKPGAYLLAADMIVDTVGQLYALKTNDAPEPLPLLVQEERFAPSTLATPSAVNLSPKFPGIDNLNYPAGDGYSYEIDEAESNLPYQEEFEQDVQINGDTRPAEKPPKLDYIAKPFDLRYEIANKVSPLRAKILIFSSLHYKFSPRDRDWADLSSHDLDDLLLELFQTCQTYEELETRLYATARQLEDPQEQEQAAGSIAKSMRSLY
ncbi:hypothetical protein [Pseudanabaena sp. PCC 6802]|uniref:hypothetical protein n=1 Tax=Pseudanabaena sp. PCC 6802 TaxID=118173 RepID=UPI000347F29B|nr:hypothetical protein [Pseudanabaena sp. PCC 6802]